MTNGVRVEIGQVWADSDPRNAGRRVRITVVDEENQRARGVVVDQARNVGDVLRQTRWMSFKRFRPNNRGYRLVSNPATGTAVSS